MSNNQFFHFARNTMPQAVKSFHAERAKVAEIAEMVHPDSTPLRPLLTPRSLRETLLGTAAPKAETSR